MWGRARETDSRWVGAGPDDDLDRRLAAEDEPFDLARSHVRTMLGPIGPGALGPTLVGEPLDLAASSFDRLATGVTPREVLLAELEDAYAGGVRAIVALCRTERALDDLEWVAGRTAVHLVAAAPSALLVRDAERPIGAIVLGLDDPLGSGSGGLERVVLLSRERSLPVSVRATNPRDARDAADTLLKLGLSPGGFWIGGCAWEQDLGAAAALLQSGVAVAFDGLYRGDQAGAPGYGVGVLAASVAALVRAGHAERLLLGSGIDRGDRYRVGGGELGLAAVLGSFPLELMEEGIEAMAIQHMLVEAPARLLATRVERQ